MRKIFRLLGLGSVMAAPLTAQSTFGVVGGLVSSNLSLGSVNGGSGYGQGSHAGFAAGMSLTMPQPTNFDFAPELLYNEIPRFARDDNMTVVHSGCQ